MRSIFYTLFTTFRATVIYSAVIYSAVIYSTVIYPTMITLAVTSGTASIASGQNDLNPPATDVNLSKVCWLPSADQQFAFAHTVSEGAAVGPGTIAPDVRDHYGNLTTVQYIIRVPPTHA